MEVARGPFSGIPASLFPPHLGAVTSGKDPESLAIRSADRCSRAGRCIEEGNAILRDPSFDLGPIHPPHGFLYHALNYTERMFDYKRKGALFRKKKGSARLTKEFEQVARRLGILRQR